MNNLSWKSLAVLALAVMVAGCGPGGPRLYKAGGTVTYKGAPLSDAGVTFAYDDGNLANGMTDANGKFTLTYMGKPGGAALGKCKVGISKSAQPKVNVSSASTSNGVPKTPEEYRQREKEKTEAMVNYAKESQLGGAQPLIPKKYSDPNTSGLVYEVKADEAQNNWTIELKD